MYQKYCLFVSQYVMICRRQGLKNRDWNKTCLSLYQREFNSRQTQLSNHQPQNWVQARQTNIVANQDIRISFFFPSCLDAMNDITINFDTNHVGLVQETPRNTFDFIGLSTWSCSGKDLNNGCRTNAGDWRRVQNVTFHWERQAALYQGFDSAILVMLCRMNGQFGPWILIGQTISQSAESITLIGTVSRRNTSTMEETNTWSIRDQRHLTLNIEYSDCVPGRQIQSLQSRSCRQSFDWIETLSQLACIITEPKRHVSIPSMFCTKYKSRYTYVRQKSDKDSVFVGPAWLPGPIERCSIVSIVRR